MEQQQNGKFDVQQMFDSVCGLLYSIRRKLATVAVFALVLFLGFHVIFGANGMVVYTQKRAEYRQLQKDTTELDQENQRLTKEVQELKTDPKAIERVAREQLHYTKKGEIVYLLPQKQAQPPAAKK
jgi:cell division protein FtsB